MRQLFQPWQLPVGDHAQQHRLRLPQVAALAVQDGHAAVQLRKDGSADLVGLGADDLHLGAGGAQHEHLVQHDRVDNGHHHAVQGLPHRAERRLRRQNDKVENHHGAGHRQMEPLVQHQRGDIHAAGGSTSADGNAQRDADAKAREHSVQHQIIGQHKVAQQPLPQRHKKGTEHRACHSVQGKAASQHPPAQQQHSHVDHEQHPGHRQPGDLVEGQCDTGGTAGDEAGGHQK